MATDENPPADMVVMSAGDAMRAFEAGNSPARLRVEGGLNILHLPQDSVTTLSAR